MIRVRMQGVVATAVVAALLLGGCSSVPDAANPAHWYRSSVDYLTGDSPEKPPAKESAKENDKATTSGPVAERDQPPPGADKPFPQVASVPTERQRRPPAQGLVADPNRPRYAPAIQRQSETDTPTAAPPPPAVAGAPPAAPAPAAMPRQPVTAAGSPPSRPAESAAATSQVPRPAPASPAAPAPAAAQPPQQPTSVADVFRARLAQQQQLPASGRAEMASPTSPGGDTGTVVISSAGIQNAVPPAPSAQIRPPPPTGSAARLSATASMAPRMPTGAGAGLNAQSVRVATIQFANGSSRLDAESERVLGEVARLQRQKGGAVRVIGHASSRTRAMPPAKHEEVNHRVSAARAEAIAKALARMGVARQDIHVGAVADSQPLYYEVMPTGEAGNRRAEVYIDF